MYDTILVPVDDSDHAERAAEHGLTLARTYDASIHLLHVVEPIRTADARLSQTVVTDLAERGRERIDTIRIAVEDVAIADEYVAYGTTHRIVQAYVDDHDVDLVVVGKRGRTPSLGSTTRRLLRVLDVPILMVAG